jgi:Cu+-exporting ATPase
MKAVVFDNSGTLIERFRALKDLKTGLIIEDMSSIDIVDNGIKRALVVLQTNPKKCIINARPDQTIYEFIARNKIDFDISYSADPIKKGELIDAIKEDKAMVSDIQDSIKAVVEKKYNIQICSGSGFIVSLDKKKIEFTITAGGKIFKEVPKVIEELKKRGIEIFVASGDRRESLKELTKYLNLSKENVFDTADSWKKMMIIRKLKNKYKVMMVGNSANDILALKEADIGVLTLQQKEETPKKVFDAADVVVDNINEILDIKF